MSPTPLLPGVRHRQLQSEVEELEQTLLALAAELARLGGDMGTLATSISSMLDTLRGEVSQVAPSIHANLDALRGEVSQVAPSIHADLDAWRGEVSQVAPSIHANLDALRAEVAQLRAEVAALGGETEQNGSFRASLDERERAIVAAVQAFTMVSPARIIAFRDAVLYVERQRIPGALVECGVWRGGAMMAAALTALETGPGTRDLYLFDTFEGMPPPADVDRDAAGVRAEDLLAKADKGTSWLWAYASLDDVRANLETTGYPPHHVHYVKGRVEETLPREAPDQIAVLRLDTDWYESTRHELVHLVPRLVPNGVLIVDDFGDWAGSRKAVEEFLRTTDRPILFSRTDHTGRMAAVPAPPVGKATR